MTNIIESNLNRKSMMDMEKELASKALEQREAAWLRALTGTDSPGTSTKGPRAGDNPLKPWFTNPMGALGMRVIEEPLPPPKLKLRAHVQVTAECRKEINNWLLDRFGRKDPALKNDQYMISEKMGVIIAPPGGTALLANTLT